MRSLVKHSHAAGAADAAYAAPIGIQTLTPAPTQLLIIRTVINCMQKQNTRTKDMQLGIEILLDLYDAASDATRRKMAEYSIVCYKRINWQYESLLRMIFRRVGSVFNQTAHTFLPQCQHTHTVRAAQQHTPHICAYRTNPLRTMQHTAHTLRKTCAFAKPRVRAWSNPGLSSYPVHPHHAHIRSSRRCVRPGRMRCLASADGVGAHRFL